jgi:hypothetical protein
VRCLACNVALSDFEATRKSAMSGHFIDLCNRCCAYTTEDIDTIDRIDLKSESDFEPMVDDDEQNR